jgi:hypothetical protein
LNFRDPAKKSNYPFEIRILVVANRTGVLAEVYVRKHCWSSFVGCPFAQVVIEFSVGTSAFDWDRAPAPEATAAMM